MYFYQSQDAGLIQLCSTERLKPYIQSEPVPIRNEHSTDVLSPNLVCTRRLPYTFSKEMDAE